MKRLLSTILLFSVFQIGQPQGDRTSSADVMVWICTSPSAYAYHCDPDCSGLNRCTYDIKKISLNMAIKEWHRKPCKKCY